ncbi:MAG: type 1 glutamine amidotransferase [Planctomycetes bacterium]|nr:type 1 glutamine amidotransferase [Planctomycetota bacterium]
MVKSAAKTKTIAILVAQDFQDMEVMYPYYRFREAGFHVEVLGVTKGETYKGKYGYPVVADVSIKVAKSARYDAVIVPGGWAPDFMRREPHFAKFVAEMNKAGKLVGSICHGGWICASADILRGRTVTFFSAIRDDVVNAGAKFVDRECVVDGNLITARKPDDIPAWTSAMLGFLGN